MTCKNCDNCIHQIACFDWCRGFGQEAELCEHFSDKSEWVHLPCKVGAFVFVPWNWDGAEGVAISRIDEIQIIDAQNRWMFHIDMESDDESFNQTFGSWKFGECIGESVFLTQEEAENALAERSRK